MNNKIELNYGHKLATFFLPDTFNEVEYLEVMRKILRNCGFSYSKSLTLKFEDDAEKDTCEGCAHN